MGRTETDLQRTPNHVRRIGTAEPRATGVSPPSRMGNALAKALPQLLGRLPPVSWRTPLQLRSPNPGGLTPPLLFARRSPADGIATFAMHKRTCTGAAGVSPPCGCQSYGRRDYVHIRKRSSLAASGAAGVSPPWFWKRTCTGASAIVRQTADRRVGGRCCNRSRVTTEGLRPPLLFARRSSAGGIATFAMHKRTRTKSCGREPAVSSGTAPATTIPHTFGHGRRTRGAGAPGVNPPCVALTYLHRRFRSCSADCRRCVGERRCNNVAAATGGLRPPALVRARSPADGIATFTMYKRTISATSSGREPAVGRADALAMALRQLSEDCCRCVGGRRCNRVRATTGAITPPALVPDMRLSPCDRATCDA